jgi:hypothetical protein
LSMHHMFGCQLCWPVTWGLPICLLRVVHVCQCSVESVLGGRMGRLYCWYCQHLTASVGSLYCWQCGYQMA